MALSIARIISICGVIIISFTFGHQSPVLACTFCCLIISIGLGLSYYFEKKSSLNEAEIIKMNQKVQMQMRLELRLYKYLLELIAECVSQLLNSEKSHEPQFHMYRMQTHKILQLLAEYVAEKGGYTEINTNDLMRRVWFELGYDESKKSEEGIYHASFTRIQPSEKVQAKWPTHLREFEHIRSLLNDILTASENLEWKNAAQ